MENVLNNFGLITKNFEEIQNLSLFLENGNLIATDFETCEVEKLKWKYQEEPYESMFRIYAGFNDTNEYLLKFSLVGSDFSTTNIIINWFITNKVYKIAIMK